MDRLLPLYLLFFQCHTASLRLVRFLLLSRPSRGPSSEKEQA